MGRGKPARLLAVDVRVGLRTLEREVEAMPKTRRPEVETVKAQLSEHLAQAGDLADKLGSMMTEGQP